MIEKLSEYKITSRDGSFINVDCNAKIINTLVQKINELVEFCNDIGNARSFLERHEEQIDELQTKVNKMAENLNFAQPEVKENAQDPYNEQRWVGCLCKLWTGDGLVRYGILRGVALNRKKTNYPYQALSTSFEHCEPVKPDDDIIFKGE